jgi:transcriptional regulator with XRE-family HTH domain
MNNIPAKHLKGYASRLKHARTAQKLTQEQLADRCGLTAMHISHFEQGTRLPNLLNAINISRALDVRLDWLAQEEPYSHEPSITA